MVIRGSFLGLTEQGPFVIAMSRNKPQFAIGHRICEKFHLLMNREREIVIKSYELDGGYPTSSSRGGREEVFFERETHCGSHRTEWVGIEPKVRIFWRRQFAVQITIIGQRAARHFLTEDEMFFVAADRPLHYF